MKRHLPVLFSIAALFIAALSAAGQAGAGVLRQVSVQDGAPTFVSYQGLVTVSGTAFSGAGYFKFAVVGTDGQTTWSNDGTSVGGSEPSASVPLTVTNGLFNVLLGDTSLGMDQITYIAFAKPDTSLRVWFATDNVNFQLLEPDRRIAAVPYAMQAEIAKQADMVGGYPSSQLATLGHKHAGDDIISGTVSANYVDSAIARDSEITTTVWANDGPGSGLNADQVDSLHADQLRAVVATANYQASASLGTTCAAYAPSGTPATITITAPGAGTMVVEANTYVTLSDGVNIILALSNTQADCGTSVTRWYTGSPKYQLLGGLFDYTLQEVHSSVGLSFQVRRSFAITTAGTYTYYLNGIAETPTTGSHTWQTADFIARYYP